MIGPNYRMDHDVSLLVPEVWCRMRPEEQQPAFLIENGFLEKVADFDLGGRRVRASILGYRITQKFVNAFLGRVFSNPNIVFNDEMLCPEKQDPEIFAEGIFNILETQKRVAEHYFHDGSVEAACPPLEALLHIMKDGNFQGMTLEDPKFRQLFEREAMIRSTWYQARLNAKQTRDVALYQKHIASLENFLSKEKFADAARELKIAERLGKARTELNRLKSPEYLKFLFGTIGADPLEKQLKS
jgi:hypothetical protein